MISYIVKTQYYTNKGIKVFEQKCSCLTDAITLLEQWTFVSNCIKSEVIDVKNNSVVTNYIRDRSESFGEEDKSRAQ